MPRFFAVEGNDVTAFGSHEEAEDYLEVYDVASIKFFAEDGTELRLRTEGFRVVVTDEEVGKSPQDLTEKLRRHLRAVPQKRRAMPDPAVDSASLPELVEETFRVEAMFRKKR
jgi:hypothetical protein